MGRFTPTKLTPEQVAEARAIIKAHQEAGTMKLEDNGLEWLGLGSDGEWVGIGCEPDCYLYLINRPNRTDW